MIPEDLPLLDKDSISVLPSVVVDYEQLKKKIECDDEILKEIMRRPELVITNIKPSQHFEIIETL